MTSRHGMTLIETSALMLISALVLTSADAALHQLRRLSQGGGTAGFLAEQACDLLRKDLAAGSVQPAGEGLRVAQATGEIAWYVADGRLHRGERALVAVSHFALERQDGRQVVVLTPVGLPTRRIEVQP